MRRDFLPTLPSATIRVDKLIGSIGTLKLRATFKDSSLEVRPFVARRVLSSAPVDSLYRLLSLPSARLAGATTTS